MQALHYEFEPDQEKQPAIGLVVLQSDETMEHELKLWLPAHYRLFHSRIPNDACIGEDSLQAMHARLPNAVALLPSHTQFKVIVYGCTSASTVIGEEAVTEAVRSVYPDVAVTNPFTALKVRLQHIEARRIALLTPYVPEVSAALVEKLNTAGFRVINSASFNEAMDDRVARISQQSLLDAVQLLATRDPVDAVVASCTNLRTHAIVEQASAACGCEVISSNSALAWHIRSLVEEPATMADSSTATVSFDQQ
ncbi:MAG: hypothetical protein AB8B63_21090 [Granulosicoccus sp.]